MSAGPVLRRLHSRAHAGFEDSFASVDLRVQGMDLLFEATWIHRAPDDGRRRDARGSAPRGWTVVRTAERLDTWTSGHDTAGVLLPGILDRAHLLVLLNKAPGRSSPGRSLASPVAPSTSPTWSGCAESRETLSPGQRATPDRSR